MKEKKFCRKCQGLRNHKDLFEKITRGGDDEGYFQWIDKYIVIECLGCETISFLKIYGNTEMFEQNEEGYQDFYNDETIFPLYLESGEELKYKYYLPDNIKEIYSETISALKSNAFILAAGGLRAIIEALCNHLKIKKDNLSNRIDLLHKKGHLTLSESKRLHSIRFIGNDALHEIEKPKKMHLYLLLEIINHLLANLFINDKIIKGKVDTLIDNYEEFVRLVKSKIKKEMIGQNYTILQIIDKARRLISKENLDDYEKKFIEDIKAAKYSFIKVSNTKEETTYEILTETSTYNFGII